MTPSTRDLSQRLVWGNIHQERRSPADTMYAMTGRRIYVIGDIDGRFRPRSNPYDVYAFGAALPDDPLANRLQGVWAQPVRGIGSFGYTVWVGGEPWRLEDADTFTQTFADVQFTFQQDSLQATRRDFAALDLPVLFSSLTLRSSADQPVAVQLALRVTFDFQDAWFTHLAERRNTGQTIGIEQGCLVARAEAAPQRWAAVVGSVQTGVLAQTLDRDSGELRAALTLIPGEPSTLTFGMVIESQRGAAAALTDLTHARAESSALLAERQALYQGIFLQGPRLTSPDARLNDAFSLAQANLHLLEAEQPGLGRYCYAGLEMFPFWFSNDGAYSTVGMMASGLRETALAHIRIGQRFQAEGRIPHQISPSAQTAFPGNAQETPLWVLGIWDAYRWTVDLDFLKAVYPAARQGMLDYVLVVLDPDGDGYPSGPGMVEVEGMGAEKLDSAVYTWAALRALADMANVLGEMTDAGRMRARAARIAEQFEADWWDARHGCYAMSLEDADNRRAHVPHWAIITPLEVGLATPAHAAQTFVTLRAEYLNRWGLKHTAGADERVWTLPTLLLSRAAFRYGEAALGLEMLHHAAKTLQEGSIGMFHELIPQGACFVQLWSAAVFVRGVIEDLLGLEVHAAEHRVVLHPHIPAGWDAVTLQNLRFGEHLIHVQVRGDAVTVTHPAGPQALEVVVSRGDGEVCRARISVGSTEVLRQSAI